MTGTISLLKNGQVMRISNFASKRDRNEIANQWTKEVRRPVKHSPYFSTVFSVYEISIILNI